MTNYKFIGTGTTDASGVARLTKDPQGQTINGYTGTGNGEIDFIASLDNPIVDGSIVSEPYDVFDTIAYFDGVVNNHFTNAVETSITGGINLTSTSINNIFQKNGEQLFIPTNTDFCIEFDVINSNQWVVYLFKATNTRYKQIGGVIPTTSTYKNIKYVYSNGAVEMFIDKVSQVITSNVEITDVSYCGFGFIDWQSDLDCTVKNLKVYPI